MRSFGCERTFHCDCFTASSETESTLLIEWNFSIWCHLLHSYPCSPKILFTHLTGSQSLFNQSCSPVYVCGQVKHHYVLHFILWLKFNHWTELRHFYGKVIVSISMRTWKCWMIACVTMHLLIAPSINSYCWWAATNKYFFIGYEQMIQNAQR